MKKTNIWYCVCVESKIYRWNYLQVRNRLTDIENKLTVTKWEKGWGRYKLGVWDLQIQITIHKIGKKKKKKNQQQKKQGPTVKKFFPCYLLRANISPLSGSPSLLCHPFTRWLLSSQLTAMLSAFLPRLPGPAAQYRQDSISQDWPQACSWESSTVAQDFTLWLIAWQTSRGKCGLNEAKLPYSWVNEGSQPKPDW